jgi:GNAT superfamily N-acetyltransferase
MGYSMREARTEEAVIVAEFAAMIHAESSYASMDFDPLKATTIASTCIREQHGFCRLIVNDQPVGVLMGFMAPSWFGHDQIAADVIFYIRPEHRGRCLRQVKQIVHEYRDWALQLGAKRIQLATSTHYDIDKTARLYEKLGFPRSGTSHTMLVN